MCVGGQVFVPSVHIGGGGGGGGSSLVRGQTKKKQIQTHFYTAVFFLFSRVTVVL